MWAENEYLKHLRLAIRRGLPLLFPLLFLLLPYISFAQKNVRGNLENKRKSLQNEITLANKLLDETRNLKDQSMGELKLLQKQILLREELLRQLKMGIGEITKEIEETEQMILTLEEDLTVMKQRYGELAFATYKALSSRNEMFYILSADNLNQAQARVRYFQELSAYHKSQMEMIRRTQAFLTRKKAELEEAKKEKESLMTDEKQEADKLKDSRQEKDKLFKKLKKDEDKYKKTIKEKQLALNRINKEIEDLIAKEMAATSAASRDILLPLSKEFAENKGKMPWPLPSGSGVITTPFGVTEDESGLQLNNTGIDISTSEGQPIRAVFDGKVVQVQSIPMFGKVVIMQHGAFYTVYAHLSNTLVEVGQEIKKLDSVGTAKTDKSTGETKVHFQVFQNKTPLNPEEWLVKKK